MLLNISITPQIRVIFMLLVILLHINVANIFYLSEKGQDEKYDHDRFNGFFQTQS
jgi:hypothetical protein